MFICVSGFGVMVVDLFVGEVGFFCFWRYIRNVRLVFEIVDF